MTESVLEKKRTLPIAYGSAFKILSKIPYNNQWYRYIKANCHQTAKRKKIAFDLDSLYIKNLFIKEHKRCHYCRIHNDECTQRYGCRLTIDRITPILGYTKGNVYLACPICNLLKGNDLTVEQTIRIGKQVRSLLYTDGKIQWGHLGKENKYGSTERTGANPD